MRPFLCSCDSVLPVVLFWLSGLLQPCEPSLIITLNELGDFPVTIATKPNQTRTLDLVTNHTYHISCYDDSPHGSFDIATNDIWWHDETPVTKRLSSFPPSGEPAVYSSTHINALISNEWTLVLQKLGVANTGVGVFLCRGLDGQVITINIRQTSHTVIAGDPERFLVVGSSTSNSIVTLTTFVSPPLPHSSITWLLNGSPSPFPTGVSPVGTDVFLSSPITLNMHGNYTCLADFGEGVALFSATFIVAVYALPSVRLSPDVSLTSVQGLNDSRFVILCTERTGVPTSHSFSWNRNGTLLMADGERVQITSTSSNTEMMSLLVIDPLLPKDVGDYSCMAQNTGGTVETSFSLTNMLEVSTIDNPKVYLEGATISFQVHISTSSASSSSASSSSSSSSSLTQMLRQIWKKNGQQLPDDSKYSSKHSALPDGASIISLDVMDVQSDDSGMYSCDLTNNISSKTVVFDHVGVVNVAISSSLYASPHDVLTVGSDASLLCEATFSNIPISYMDFEVVMSWGRDGGLSLSEHVQMSNTMTMLSSSAFHRTYRSNLTFSPATRGDGGKYICSVRYRIGSGEVIVHHHENSVNIDSILFQLRLLGIKSSCQEWVNSDVESKLNEVVNATILHVNQLCPACALTFSHFTASGFYCSPASPQVVTFTARVHGTQTSTSLALLGHILSWTKHGGAISEGDIQAWLDSSCSFEISTLQAVECSDETSSTPATAGGVAGGVPMVVVISVSAAVGCVLVLLVALLFSLVICSFCRRQRATITSESKDTEKSTGPVRVTNPYFPPSSLNEGLEPEYEELDKYTVPDMTRRIPDADMKMDSVKVADNCMYQHNHLTYDYAAV